MRHADIGVYGLGTMGSAIALNMAEKGIPVAVANRESEWVADFIAEAGPLSSQIIACEDLKAFVAALSSPRVVLFMIPSGVPVDDTISQVLPLLDAGDMIVDAGNSDFHDTRRRSKDLQAHGVHFVGMGVSGGEEGARHGPSMMVGGSAESWARLHPVLNAIAADFEGNPCVAHVGPDGAGHFVKTVHNGIEYADMQVIAELYGIMRDASARQASEIGQVFAAWNTGPLQSFLTEITATILQAEDPQTGWPVVDVIRDQAGQKGTGRWTVIEALKLGQSPSGIVAAVGARSWSSQKDLRAEIAESLTETLAAEMPKDDVLGAAFEAARLLLHLQGFAVLQAASQTYDWALDLSRIAEIWRAGCIIRSVLLNDLADILKDTEDDSALLRDPAIQTRLRVTVPALRAVVAASIQAGVPVPAMSALLAWFDTMRQARGTTNLIQAQRDFFGYHGYERIDADGPQHGPWWSR